MCPNCKGEGCPSCKEIFDDCQVLVPSNDSKADQLISAKEADMDEFKGRTEGVDVDGFARKLGDRDSMGHVVGFIDDDYNCWETIKERDTALTAGRYVDAMHEWERNGKKDPHPKPLEIAQEVCIDPDNIPAAVEEAHDSWDFTLRVRPIARQQMVEEVIERFRSLKNPSIHDLRNELDKFIPRKLEEE